MWQITSKIGKLGAKLVPHHGPPCVFFNVDPGYQSWVEIVRKPPVGYFFKLQQPTKSSKIRRKKSMWWVNAKKQGCMLQTQFQKDSCYENSHWNGMGSSATDILLAASLNTTSHGWPLVEIPPGSQSFKWNSGSKDSQGENVMRISWAFHYETMVWNRIYRQLWNIMEYKGIYQWNFEQSLTKNAQLQAIWAAG